MPRIHIEIILPALAAFIMLFYFTITLDTHSVDKTAELLRKINTAPIAAAGIIIGLIAGYLYLEVNKPPEKPRKIGEPKPLPKIPSI